MSSDDRERVLVVAPRAPTVSQVWMQRMLEYLGEELIALSTVERNPVSPPTTTAIGLSSSIRTTKYPLARATRWNGADALGRLVRETSATAVVVHFAHLAELVLSRAKWLQSNQIPVLVMCHGTDVTWSAGRLAPPIRVKHYGQGRKYQERLRSMSGRCLFVANSEFTRQRLVSVGFDRQRVAVNRLGVELPGPRSAPDSSPTQRVLFLGRLVPVKGPIETMEAYTRAVEMGMPGRLVVAGDGPLRKACEKLRRHSGLASRIDMLGAVGRETAADLMGSASIFTAHNRRCPRTGREEAYGVTFVEAAAHGVPAVTARSGGVSEIVSDGVTGVLVPPGDVNAHASALFHLQRDEALRRAMGANARSFVESKLTLQHERTRLFDLIKAERQRLRAI